MFHHNASNFHNHKLIRLSTTSESLASYLKRQFPHAHPPRANESIPIHTVLSKVRHTKRRHRNTVTIIHGFDLNFRFVMCAYNIPIPCFLENSKLRFAMPQQHILIQQRISFQECRNLPDATLWFSEMMGGTLLHIALLESAMINDTHTCRYSLFRKYFKTYHLKGYGFLN